MPAPHGCARCSFFTLPKEGVTALGTVQSYLIVLICLPVRDIVLIAHSLFHASLQFVDLGGLPDENQVTNLPYEPVE